jgi:hypothetical protein
MVLNNLMGVIDTSALGESATAIWAMVVALGGNFVVSIFNFIKVGVSGGKIKSLSDFSVVASKSLDFAKKEITSISAVIKKEVVDTIVTPLVSEVTDLKAENKLLANLVVMGFSLAPIPLSQKKDLFTTINKISSVTTEAIQLLATSIETQEIKELEYEEENDNLEDKINNS